jgi:hypothetical protein
MPFEQNVPNINALWVLPKEILFQKYHIHGVLPTLN